VHETTQIDANAVAEARAALATFERLGATSYRDRARALLRTLGVGVRMRDRSGATLFETLTARESRVPDLGRQGSSQPRTPAPVHTLTKLTKSAIIH